MKTLLRCLPCRARGCPCLQRANHVVYALASCTGASTLTCVCSSIALCSIGIKYTDSDQPRGIPLRHAEIGRYLFVSLVARHRTRTKLFLPPTYIEHGRQHLVEHSCLLPLPRSSSPLILKAKTRPAPKLPARPRTPEEALSPQSRIWPWQLPSRPVRYHRLRLRGGETAGTSPHSCHSPHVRCPAVTLIQ